jgi:hypothetical protein
VGGVKQLLGLALDLLELAQLAADDAVVIGHLTELP